MSFVAKREKTYQIPMPKDNKRRTMIDYNIRPTLLRRPVIPSQAQGPPKLRPDKYLPLTPAPRKIGRIPYDPEQVERDIGQERALPALYEYLKEKKDDAEIDPMTREDQLQQKAILKSQNRDQVELWKRSEAYKRMKINEMINEDRAQAFALLPDQYRRDIGEFEMFDDHMVDDAEGSLANLFDKRKNWLKSWRKLSVVSSVKSKMACLKTRIPGHVLHN